MGDNVDIENLVHELNLTPYACYAFEKFGLNVPEKLAEDDREHNGNWEYKGWLDERSQIVPEGFDPVLEEKDELGEKGAAPVAQERHQERLGDTYKRTSRSSSGLYENRADTPQQRNNPGMEHAE